MLELSIIILKCYKGRVVIEIFSLFIVKIDVSVSLTGLKEFVYENLKLSLGS